MNSKRKMRAICLVSVGVISLIVGVVAGKLLLSMLVRKTNAQVCINSESHSSFKDWKGDATKKSETLRMLVYYWNITNVHNFLHGGEKPNVQQVGPYIYRFATEKINIKFLPHTVKYITITQSEYDHDATIKQCPNCREHDTVSVINTAYLALMMAAGGDNNFALNVIPSFIQTILQLLTMSGNTNNNNLPYNFPSYSQYTNTNCSLIEMSGLYTVLSNATLLGTEKPPPENCAAAPTHADCLNIGFLPLAQNMLTRKGYLVATNSSMNDTILMTLSTAIASLFCPNTTTTCFHILNEEHLVYVANYVTQHLVEYAMDLLIDSKQYGIVTTRKQSDLTSGYAMDILGFDGPIAVTGLVANDTDKEKAVKNGHVEEYYNCDASNPFTWKTHNNRTVVPDTYHVNTTTAYRKIDGKYKRTIFEKKSSLSTCKTTQETEHDTYDVFDTTLQTSYRIVKKSSSSMKSVNVQVFELDYHHVFGFNGNSVLTEGVIDLSNTMHGVPYLMSAPHFLEGDVKLVQQFHMTPDYSKHKSVFQIEPISGGLIGLTLRLQVNTAIPKHLVSAPRKTPLNISYVDDVGRYLHPIPLAWIEVNAMPTDEQLNTISVVTDVMKGSCAAFIFGPLLGFLCICAAIYIVVKAAKSSSSISDMNESKS